jgi:hypothetical protein
VVNVNPLLSAAQFGGSLAGGSGGMLGPKSAAIGGGGGSMTGVGGGRMSASQMALNKGRGGEVGGTSGGLINDIGHVLGGLF